MILHLSYSVVKTHMVDQNVNSIFNTKPMNLSGGTVTSYLVNHLCNNRFWDASHDFSLYIFWKCVERCIWLEMAVNRLWTPCKHRYSSSTRLNVVGSVILERRCKISELVISLGSCVEGVLLSSDASRAF